MKVLLLGGNGMMGPWVVRSLEGRHELRITDVTDPPDTRHEFRWLGADDLSGVIDAAGGMDAIINLSVVRQDRKAAFDVSTRGVYNAMVAARTHGIRRVINTGPRGQVASDRYADFDFDLHPDIPPQTGTRLYWITKGLGFEIARVFEERHDIYVQTLLFYQLKDPVTLAGPDGGVRLGKDTIPYVVAWQDAGEAVRLALEVELAALPSRFETYFVTTDLPHGVYLNEKLKRVLGWQPAYRFEQLWTKDAAVWAGR